jgi:hypothetical protein
MGLIIDLDYPAPLPATLPPARGRKRRLGIEEDTPIVPRAVAESVWEEACAWLGEELPRRWVWRLAVRANAVYARNARFRRLIRRAGDPGRDWLWAFTRHWLAALIWRQRRDLHARLPDSYNVGGQLPACRFNTMERSPLAKANTGPANDKE